MMKDFCKIELKVTVLTTETSDAIIKQIEENLHKEDETCCCIDVQWEGQVQESRIDQELAYIDQPEDFFEHVIEQNDVQENAKTEDSSVNKPIIEEWYVWREYKKVEGEQEPRLLVPWANPTLWEEPIWEKPMDTQYKTVNEAIEDKLDRASDEDWLLVKQTSVVVSRHKPSCRYCSGNCPNDEDNSCDGYSGDIDGLYNENDVE